MKNTQALSEFNILNIEKVTQRFGGVTALNELSFSVRQGQIVSVIGPNGAGKTTLFNCITGLYRPDSGSMFFGDSQINLNRMQPYEIAACDISRTFQTIRLFKNMTALENVMVGEHSKLRSGMFGCLIQPRWTRVEEKRMEQRAHRLLDFFCLDGKANELARNLAYGHQRKLEIARALASDPKLLLLDEPAAGMNPKEKEELLGYLTAIRDRGVTLVLIEHDMKVVMPISDHIVVLDYGKKIAEGKPKEIQCNKTVIEAYLGKPCE